MDLRSNKQTAKLPNFYIGSFLFYEEGGPTKQIVVFEQFSE
jgi:hypothetical protein